jgi:beta-mannosidase
MIWQDFELNWVHDASLDFERRARVLQREMIDLLGNHPSIITWACHNEPTMIFSRRANLEQHPDPILYADACHQDPTRPVFLCSGQMESDWRRSGDVHSYYGAIWTSRYTDLYRRSCRLNTEFGFEAPAALTTLQAYPECWERLKHLEPQIDMLWGYQAQLIQFHVEHFRRLREQSCAGYILFWLADLVPQVGCGVLDSSRQPKGGYRALQVASQPLHIALEHNGHRPYAWWVFNDTPDDYPDVLAECRIVDREQRLKYEAQISLCIAANRSQRIGDANWPVPVSQWDRIELTLRNGDGSVLACNHYDQPFQPMHRPEGYPWKYNPFLGCKVFDLPGASSLADQNLKPVLKRIPLAIREQFAEWALRQRLPPHIVSWIAHLVDYVNG